MCIAGEWLVLHGARCSLCVQGWGDVPRVCGICLGGGSFVGCPFWSVLGHTRGWPTCRSSFGLKVLSILAQECFWRRDGAGLCLGVQLLLP